MNDFNLKLRSYESLGSISRTAERECHTHIIPLSSATRSIRLQDTPSIAAAQINISESTITCPLHIAPRKRGRQFDAHPTVLAQSTINSYDDMSVIVGPQVIRYGRALESPKSDLLQCIKKSLQLLIFFRTGDSTLNLT